MDETLYAILKLLFDFALEVWFSIICDVQRNLSTSIHRSSLL